MSVKSIHNLDFPLLSLEETHSKKKLDETTSFSQDITSSKQENNSSLSCALQCVYQISQHSATDKHNKKIIGHLISRQCQSHAELEKRNILNQKFAECISDYISSSGSLQKSPKESINKFVENQELFYQFVSLFYEEERFNNPLLFAKDWYYKNCMNISKAFFTEAQANKLCTEMDETMFDLEELCPRKMHTSHEIASYEKMMILDALKEEFIFDLYKLRRSAWHPVHSILFLDEELQKYGPLMVRGSIGSNYYQNPPIFREKRNGISIYLWNSDVTKLESDKSNFVLICGISIKNKIIYFTDPVDRFRTKKIKEKRVYEIPFQQFLDSISDLYGKKSHIKDGFFSTPNEGENNFVLYGYGYKNGKWKSTSKHPPLRSS